MMNYSKILTRNYSRYPSKDFPKQTEFNKNSERDIEIPKYNPDKFYENADTMKTFILKQNNNKSGIYKWTNLKIKDFYIGSSVNLSGQL
jgi:hypothetical protein